LTLRLLEGIDSNFNLRFLLAPLHIDSLAREPTVGHIELALQSLPRGLDETYKQAMIRIESQGGGFRELAKRVLSWVIHAKGMLSTAELRHAVAVEPGKPELNGKFIPNIEIIGSVCAGLVTIDPQSDVVRLVHYTTQEYFEQTQKDWFPNAETDITITCVTYLSFHTFESGFCQTDEEFERRLQLNPLYGYAARNWGHYARAASTEVEKLILSLLESETKKSAANQAMLASREDSWYSYHSQRVLRKMTGVHLAAYFGLIGVIMALLKNKHNPDVKDTFGRSPLWLAAENGHEAVVKLLLEKGAEVESKDQGLQTPLLRAAENGHEAVVKLLLEKGAELESKDDFFCGSGTPLSRAAAHGHKAVVKLLLEKGAGPESKAVDGQTSLWWAAENGHEAVVKLLL
jgi:hypothetical protein